MANDNKTNHPTERQEKIWSKINFYSALAGLGMIVACLLFLIITEVCGAGDWTRLCALIVLAVTGAAAVTLMIVSWYKLRSIKNARKNGESSADDTENKQ